MDPDPYFTSFLVAAAYLSGTIPFGLIVARMRGVDVRQVGSGNIGATNVSRAVGKKLGALVLMLDAAKGALPVVGALLLARAGIAHPLGVAACALAAVAGHCFPVWLKFRGGKGVATSLGVFVVLDPMATGICVLVFAVVVGITRVASVGSLVAASAFVVSLQLRGRSVEEVALASVIVAIIVVRHVDNIRRLFRGKEHKVDGNSRGSPR
jgi:glycerol-3-phosphate acyltransferase PlsY